MKAAKLTFGNTRTFVKFAELVKELKAFWDNDQGEKEEITIRISEKKEEKREPSEFWACVELPKQHIRSYHVSKESAAQQVDLLNDLEEADYWRKKGIDEFRAVKFREVEE